jgi:SAM-dependent methyltransferase
MHFTMVILDHPDGRPLKAFNDVILPLYFAFRRLGWQVEMLRQTFNPHSRNVLFGGNQNPALVGLEPPADTIVYNLEQLAADNSHWNTGAYLKTLKQFTVWDYSRRNLEYLSAQGIEAAQLPLGYVPEMTRLRADFPAGRDVLFYGLVSPRRKAVLDELQGRGVSVNQPPAGTFGRARDLAIADSRLALNIHHYVPASLELGRLGYLWANRRPVVSELRPDTERPPGLEEACAYCRYEDLAPTVLELLADERRRQAQAEAGFAAFSAFSLEKSLERLVGRRLAPGQGADFKEARPDHLHIGSGRDFRNKALNVDIAAHCRPDLVLDISRPLVPGARHQTERFGEIDLAPGSFRKITAFEVLEHVADLPQAMRNFLDLLEEGGRLIVSVPYDLSCGAWQDPTHVRAFNENSWDYYSGAAWYLGWRDERFEVENLAYTWSKLGVKLLSRGRGVKKICRVPRAVDGLRVTLRKRKATEEEIRFYDQMFREVYSRTVINWEPDDEDLDRLNAARERVFKNLGAWWLTRARLLALNIGYRMCKVLAWAGCSPHLRDRLKARRNCLRDLLGL